MKTLAAFFTKGEFLHKQHLRKGDLAIYERWKEGQLAPTHFETIQIRHNKARELHGKQLEASESYPTAEEWGVRGFTLPTYDAALTTLKMLVKRDEKRAQQP